MREAFQNGSHTYSPAVADARNYMQWVTSVFRPYLKGAILEIGIGHGSYAEMLSEYGQYIGVDIDAESVQQATVRYPGLDFFQASVLERGFSTEFAPDGLDAIVCFNVLEHIREDYRAIENLVAALRPDGHLLVGVPAMKALYNDLDALAGHHRRYDKADLRHLLSSHPLRVRELWYFNPIGGVGWWIHGWKQHDSLNSEGLNRQIRFFDKYVVPISRSLNPLTRGFFGQSIICVAERL